MKRNFINNAVPCCGGETSKGQATMVFTGNSLMCEHAQELNKYQNIEKESCTWRQYCTDLSCAQQFF